MRKQGGKLIFADERLAPKYGTEVNVTFLEETQSGVIGGFEIT